MPKRSKHSPKSKVTTFSKSKFSFLLHPIALAIALLLIVASAIFMSQEVSGGRQGKLNDKQPVPIVWLKVKFKNSQPASSFKVFKQGVNSPIVVSSITNQEGSTFFALKTDYKIRHEKYIIETIFADNTSQESSPFEIGGLLSGEYGAGIESVEFSGSL